MLEWIHTLLQWITDLFAPPQTLHKKRTRKKRKKHYHSSTIYIPFHTEFAPEWVQRVIKGPRHPANQTPEGQKEMKAFQKKHFQTMYKQLY